MARQAGAAVRLRVWSPAQVGRVVQGMFGFCRHLVFDDSSRHKSEPDQDPVMEAPAWTRSQTAEAKAANGLQLEYVPLPRDMVLTDWDVTGPAGLDLVSTGLPPDTLARKWFSMEGADTLRGQNLWHQLGADPATDPKPAGANERPEVSVTHDVAFRSRFKYRENQAWDYHEMRVSGLGSQYLASAAGL